MKQLQRPLALILCAALLWCALPASAGQSDWEQTAQFLCGQAKTPQAASTHGDWEVFALARTGAAAPEGYYDAWPTLAERALAQGEGRLPGPVAESLRLALALLALDQELSDVGGHDLLALVKDTGLVCRSAVLGPAFGILILENCGGDPQAEAVYLRHLLDSQLADGGWALSGEAADPDATAMALQALSFLQEEEGAREAIDRGLARLSALQTAGGGFTAWGASSSESISQAILALCMLGVESDDPRFVKNGLGLLDALLAFRLEDGSFRHVMDGGYDAMATHQAMLALDSLRRVEEGLPHVYQITDRVTVDRSFTGLPGKDEAIAVPEERGDAPAFSDISGLAREQDILALARRGIVNGMGEGKFEPDGLLTRAQFCAVAVRALGLPTIAVSAQVFSDVPLGAWYRDAVLSAYGFGAVEGVGGGAFAPERAITRQEAAVLVSRLAEKCGMQADYDDTAARNVLAQFGDYRTCGGWAREALAFCYDNGILDDSVMDIRPTQAISRAEAAGMFYALLDGALLLEG